VRTAEEVAKTIPIQVLRNCYKNISYRKRHGKYPSDAILPSEHNRIVREASLPQRWSPRDTERLIIERMAEMFFEKYKGGLNGR
jgi:hypothetical protein